MKYCLLHLNSRAVSERVEKQDLDPRAKRAWSYPLAAIREALVNAVYHRSYEAREPIEVRVLPHCISIHSVPGPDRSVPMNELAQGRAQLRSYRNRRVGEFLKELDLTEGRGTGIPRIIEELRKNGSPPPKFHTNDERTFFVTEIPIHPSFLTEQEPVGAHDRAHDGAHDGAHDVRGLDEALNPTEERILQFCSASAKNLAEIMAHLSLATRTGFLTRTLERLTEAGLLAMTIPDKPRSKNQKRITTPKGLAALKNTPGRVQDDKT